MFAVIKRVCMGASLLAIMPLAIFFSGWQWQYDATTPLIRFCYLITATSDDPWAAITSILLAVWFTWLLRIRGKKIIIFLAILVIATIGGQLIKIAIKNMAEEPRPFVVWLQNNQTVEVHKFYQLSRAERLDVVKQALSTHTTIPQWLKTYWQNETGYAFPSGHTIFAATWALIAVALLWPHKKYLPIVLLLAWATAVLYSRLALGMHWPIDLLVGIVLSCMNAILVGGIYTIWSTYSLKEANNS